MVQLRTKRDFHQARASVPTWHRITGREVRTEFNHCAVEAFPSLTMIFHLIKLLINLKEATCTTPRAFRIRETVTQIRFRGETAFKVKQELEMAEFLHKMAKMHRSKVKDLGN